MDWTHINPLVLGSDGDAYIAVAPPFVYLAIDTSYSGVHWRWGYYSLSGIAYIENLTFVPQGERRTIHEAQQDAENHYHRYEVAMED